MEAPAPTTAVSAVGISASAEATMAEAGAPETAEAVIAEAGAPEVTMAIVMAARLSVQGAEIAEVEDLRLRCADAKVEVATTQTQLTPLAAWIKELEEELTRTVSDQDAFRFWAEEATASGKALVGQLGAKESAHWLTKGALNEVLASVEASQIEAVVLRGTVEELGSKASRAAAETRRWEQKAKESEAKFTRAAEASSVVQTVLNTEIEEHEALKRATLSACEALEVEGVHDGYVLPDDDEEANAAVAKLMEAEGPGAALATLFEEEVVPPLPSAGAEGPEP
ncbi:uncharacterized protein [Miscanthus floridulus]|uniref:uncharacterized protein n=1 Tax=Miscanthus floridulus TaxID=154761 RepID=UPI00345912D0